MPNPFRKKQLLPLRYYLYMSSTKVDALLPQVPLPFARSFEAEFTVNLGIVGATVRDRPAENRPELAAQVGLLTTYLERHEQLGSIAEPGRYIKDTASFQYGVVNEYAADLAFFGGAVGGVKVGLIGSPSSLVGATPDAKAGRSMYYYTLKFLNQMARDESAPGGKPPYYSYEEAIDIALEALPPATFQVEFVAKMLHREPNLLVATPIWVALVS